MSGHISRGRVIALVVAVAIALYVAGLASGYLLRNGEVEDAYSRLYTLSAELEEKKTLLNDLLSERDVLKQRLDEISSMLDEVRNEASEKERELENSINEYRSEVESLRAEKARLDEKLKKTVELASLLEKAVPILNQLKLDVPTDREGALNYWTDIKNAVAEFEPALTAEVDRVINNIDGWVAYNVWLNNTPGAGASLSEIIDWVLSYPTEADTYFSAVDQFNDEFLNAVATRIMALRESG